MRVFHGRHVSPAISIYLTISLEQDVLKGMLTKYTPCSPLKKSAYKPSCQVNNPYYDLGNPENQSDQKTI